MGRKPPHTAGRSGWPKILQPSRASSCTHTGRLPSGMPGMALLILGAMQQAPHP
jgi:hypothetical protein